jgi:hypothetical protein
MNAADFQIIARFLESFGPEAEGYGDPAASEGLVRRLEALVRGDCSSEERRAICATLDEHRGGAHLLAEMIKARRTRRDAHG